MIRFLNRNLKREQMLSVSGANGSGGIMEQHKQELLVEYEGILFGGTYSSVFQKGKVESILKEKYAIRDLKETDRLATQAGLLMYLDFRGMAFDERMKIWTLKNPGEATSVRVGKTTIPIVKVTRRLFKFSEIS